MLLQLLNGTSSLLHTSKNTSVHRDGEGTAIKSIIQMKVLHAQQRQNGCKRRVTATTVCFYVLVVCCYIKQCVFHYFVRCIHVMHPYILCLIANNETLFQYTCKSGHTFSTSQPIACDRGNHTKALGKYSYYVKVCTYTHYACMHGCKIHSTVVFHLSGLLRHTIIHSGLFTSSYNEAQKTSTASSGAWSAKHRGMAYGGLQN